MLSWPFFLKQKQVSTSEVKNYSKIRKLAEKEADYYSKIDFSASEASKNAWKASQVHFRSLSLKTQAGSNRQEIFLSNAHARAFLH